ncbi:MAG: O-antigen ligase family protein [Bacteroidia bacterium]|nr:O-antigen ligase family protein [Bacteroidia bacterium]
MLSVAVTALLTGAVISLPWSRAGLSLATAGLVLVALWVLITRQVRSIQWAHIWPALIFGMFLAGADGSQPARADLLVKLPLLVIPLAMGLLPPLAQKSWYRIVGLYILACISAMGYCLLRAGWAIWQGAGWDACTYVQLASSLDAHPTYLSLLLNLALLGLGWRWHRGAHRGQTLLGLIILAGSVILLASRTQMLITLLLTCGAIIGYAWYHRLLLRGAVVLAGVLVAGLLLAFALPENRQRLMDVADTTRPRPVREVTWNGAAVRVFIWQRASEILQAYPGGVGTGHTQAALTTAYHQHGLDRSDLNAHNQLLETGIALGWAGMAGITLFWLGVMGWAVYTRQWALLLLMSILLVSGLTESWMCRQIGVGAFVLGYAACLGAGYKHREAGISA